MPPPSSPTVWRRWLALELRRLRNEAGLGQKEAGNRCGWSGARLSYIESAKQDVREDDLDELLPLYNVPEDQWSDYYEAAERSRERGWWERYGREMPDYLGLFVGLEQGASVIQTFKPVLVPGQLQTPAYAEAVLRQDVWPRTDQEVSRLVDLRISRQAILTREDAPLTFTAVIDEAVLRHMAGGPETMADQINHLVEMAERPNVTIRVIPFERGAQSFSQTEFTIFEFARESERLLVYLEHRDQAIYMEEPQDVRGFVLAYHNLWQLADDEDQSLAKMHTIAKEYTKK